ncbi:hypothetical protein [Nocardia sp. NPDC055049]
MQKPAHPPTGGSGISPRPGLPTEDEIRAAAVELGHADEHGNYPRAIRNKLARAVQLAKQEQATAEDPNERSTAWQLVQFAEDLDAVHIRATDIGPLLVEAARHLLRSQGLRLESREETTPS